MASTYCKWFVVRLLHYVTVAGADNYTGLILSQLIMTVGLCRK